jgi:GT2 family glycosyltransferase
VTPTSQLTEEISEWLEVEAPVAVRAIDLDDGEEVLRLPASRGGEPYRRLMGLVRRHGSPLGWVSLPVSAGGEVSVAELAAAYAGAPGPDPRDADQADRLISIVIATCANPARAIDCVGTIKSVATGSWEAIVVENRPAGSTVRQALEEAFGQDPRIRYVEEERPGLSAARNAGLRAAAGDLVAFTDDDVRIDASWIPAIRSAFATVPEAGCVTGLICPLEFETPAQLLDERFAGYGKGFSRRVYSMADPPADQPLFPYSAGYFASGANLAFRTSVLRGLGGFDRRLGTGTRARGGEDLDICVRLLHSGSTVVYEPAAIVWHRHPERFEQVRRQVFDYGAGLGAMLGKQLVTGPNRLSILSRGFQGVRYYVSPKSRKNALRGSDFPRELAYRERLGLLFGPFGYLASRWSGPE